MKQTLLLHATDGSTFGVSFPDTFTREMLAESAPTTILPEEWGRPVAMRSNVSIQLEAIEDWQDMAVGESGVELAELLERTATFFPETKLAKKCNEALHAIGDVLALVARDGESKEPALVRILCR